jgi:hypothetical protein
MIVSEQCINFLSNIDRHSKRHFYLRNIRFFQQFSPYTSKSYAQFPRFLKNLIKLKLVLLAKNVISVELFLIYLVYTIISI